MELKKYQQRVIDDLGDYLDALARTDSLAEAYRRFWESRQVEVGRSGVPGYHNAVEGVPHVCYKVPTGGGKTFLACASVKPLFGGLPVSKLRAVVWLVPSEAILSQTLTALKDPSHPYRQRLNTDFGGRVEVYSKQELLTGQNFTIGAAAEQLTVMVLSYDSFRSSNKEGRKAYQANGALAPFRSTLGSPAQPIEGADETALFQVINQLNPVVIVDESHHATSALSLEMLTNFNPSFILDLTATPAPDANVISYVDALALKRANMVKLPVIAYNRADKSDVVRDAIDLRRSLEVAAAVEYRAGGNYIRPIVLFQAQPKVDEDATSFEKLKEQLVATGVPVDQIAIKTATINELKDVDLADPDCPIRFIITVNALKEGWDCPFAYILASLANKSSQVDVEQVLGRVLRQPGVRKHDEPMLNMSYVLTSSNDFQTTLARIVAGLNNAGFTARDYRVANQVEVADGNSESVEPPPAPDTDDSPDEDFLDFDPEQVADDLDLQQDDIGDREYTQPTNPGLRDMLESAKEQGEDYEKDAAGADTAGRDALPPEWEDKVPDYAMNPELADEARALRLPRFFVSTPPSTLFSTGEEGWDLLEPENLTKGFSLANKDSSVDLSAADEDMFRVDVSSSNSDVPKVWRMGAADQRLMREHFSQLTPEARRRTCTEIIYNKLNRHDGIGSRDLMDYIRRVVDGLDPVQLALLEEKPLAVAAKIDLKLKALLDEYRFERFEEGLKTGRIGAREDYQLASRIRPIDATSLIGRSLYEAEDSMNGDEQMFASRFSGMSNLRWWHRIIERRGFSLNGPLNHYPDFMVMTKRGMIVLVEPKGAQLRNEDSKRKLSLGQTWASQSGHRYRYFMVFQDGVEPLDGAETFSSFFRVLDQL